VAYCSIDLAPLKAKNTPNVLVVAIDSASAQHFGCYQYNRATTPNIDGLAAEGATYLNFSSPIDFELIALSSSLSDTYSTSLVSSHYSIFENQAFEQIVNTSQPSLSDRLFINSVPNFKPKTNRAQASMAMQLIKDSNRQGEPFFMVYNLQGCKFPNDVPPHVVGHFSSPQLSDQQKLVATYDECIWHQDRLVADLIHRLDAIELREQTIVVICGSSNTTLFPNDGRLPLIVRFPRLVEAGSKVDEPINADQVTSAISKLINLANKPAT
jgi:membrane-anchored protein YejM (alkaline phosphatase superfamily)